MTQSRFEELIHQARSGDRSAENELLQKCRAYISLIARAQIEGWMRTKFDASDLVQQTLLEAHQGIDNFKGETEAEWLGWLRGILNHNTLDFARKYQGAAKRNVSREFSIDQAGGVSGNSDQRQWELKDQTETPSRILLNREQEILMAEAVAQLPADYQEVIMLRNLQRLSFKEVAERMNRSPGAAQMLWLRSLNRLQELLESV
ncbi:MAG: RNA polymerase sigma factor [Planctomycetes bacterium]|nr:RNA polymerase sigma factor [Planctomycetota bacterium]MCH9723445.1 RNA polymerase sigma factor [Planctomycetota bacterium]MCH9775175.1 RNA polymerase sigma factor [Planctomycetota bacterium]MDF1746805.1 sigma-70 family RNA polymerase sigma factor [Gimesia sp.]